jgi:hypothetical protein
LHLKSIRGTHTSNMNGLHPTTTIASLQTHHHSSRAKKQPHRQPPHYPCKLPAPMNDDTINCPPFKEESWCCVFFITAIHPATSTPLPSHHAISQLPNSPEDSKQATIQYTCYGKAPPWYAPGRICRLDLTGNMIDCPKPLGPVGRR